MQHILTTNDFTDSLLMELFFKYTEIKNNPKKFSDSLKGRVLTSMFFEPSTRTRLSFEAAMHKLGGLVLSVEDAKGNSSDKKGETLQDSIKTASLYSDAVVIRHPHAQDLDDAVRHSRCSVINGGEGSRSHPTQSLIDYFLIADRYFFSSRPINVMITGDLEKSRTIGGLVHMLEKHQKCHFIYAFSGDPSDINFNYRTESYEMVFEDLAGDRLPEVDVLYMTRHQKERSLHRESSFVLTPEHVAMMKEDAMILHPMPRGRELPVEIDNDKRAKYWEQAENGLYIRMALLWKLLKDVEVD